MLECILIQGVGMEDVVLEKIKKFFIWEPPPPPPREPTRHDWLLLPILNAKDWLVDHPKTTTAICTFLFSIVADKMPYYDVLHKWVCWCMENETCIVGFILKHANFMILCI